MSIKKATHQLTKQHNRDLVLKTIFESESISRAEIARVTKLTRTTVSDLVATLIAEGLVKEIGLGSSMGGKLPILLSLVAFAVISDHRKAQLRRDWAGLWGVFECRYDG